MSSEIFDPQHPLAYVPAVKSMTRMTRKDRSGLEIFYPLFRVNNLGKAHAKSLANHDDFTLGDHGSIDQNIQRITGKTIKLDHRPFIQAQQITDLDFGIPNLNEGSL